MGYIKHNAICVTSFDSEEIKVLHKKAREIFEELVTEIIEGVINGYASFFIAPDGSKEGWSESNEYDKKRKEFKDLIKNGSFYCEFVDVAYDEKNEAWIDN